MLFVFPQADQKITSMPLDSDQFYIKNNPPDLTDRQQLVESLKLLSRSDCNELLGEMFELLYFTAKKYTSLKNDAQEALVDTFIYLFQ